MTSKADKLEKQYAPENRYAVFGSCLQELKISGIKGTNCKITFDYPITAIAGYNGAGKSTIAQISLCMYRAPDNGGQRKYLKDFFMKTLLDKSPYDISARISATYAADKEKQMGGQQLGLFDDEKEGASRTLDVYYSVDRWSGYKHQPQKNVYYYGMSYFIPYQELNSNLLRDGKANVTTSVSFAPEIVHIVGEILSISYKSLQNNNVSNDKRTESVISADKETASYSENHMGCGEGRLLKLINALETAPNQSLFVIEEPETALHQTAQYRFSEYLMDVVERKKHQIIFTTHSSEIQRALPPKARKYIQRETDGQTSVVNSPSIAQIQNYLSGGYDRKMVVVTEDEVGMCYVMEVLRSFNRTLFSNCEFFSMNLGYKEIKDYVKKSRKCGMHVFGIVDENKFAEVENGIIAFPEETPPEVSIFNDKDVVKCIEEEFALSVDELPEDHHDYFDFIANSTRNSAEYVRNRCIKLYVKNKSEEYFQDILLQMSAWLSTCEK